MPAATWRRCGTATAVLRRAASPWPSRRRTSPDRAARVARDGSQEDQPDPVGGECGLGLALDLHAYVVEELPLAGALLLEADQSEAAAHPLAGADRSEEAHPLEPVIDAHPDAFGDQHRVGGHAAEQRQREEAVGDGGAERSL